RQLPVEYLWGIGRLAAKLRSGFRPPPDKRPRNRPPNDEVIRQTLHVYAANLAFVASLGRRYGFEPLFYWQPNLFLKRHHSPSERIAAGHLSPFRQAFDAVSRRVRESAVLNDHPGFHDISALFDDLAAPYYVDGVHLSEPGNRLVAEAMVDDLIDLIDRRQQVSE
ncbi:MAG: hypothetical protein LGR52_09735, partial [Candidatus Thiosymbion ectosymbiont of Robbea hypermnestra]|nr:hypothetical protein [Candidatus Thiosymbion ectosymbiont of Robbea hypermnestra]